MRALLAAVFAALTGCTFLFEPEDSVGGCPAGDVIAYYDFEHGLSTEVIQDVSGNGHPGEVTAGGLVPTAGPPRHGNAAHFGGNTAVVIPHSPDFELEEGGVSLWVRLGDDGTKQGVISRDANAEELPGHFNLRTDWIDGARRMGLRIQPEGAEYSACSQEPVPTGEWQHYVANFGSPRADLYLNRYVQSDCGGGSSHGIGDNENPWVIGADSATSLEGSASPLSDFLIGEIDEVVLCRSRIDPGK